MNLSKKIIYTIILVNIFLIQNFICGYHVFAGNLTVSSGQTYTISQNAVYDEITINGTLYINKNNLTITANNLIINSGGKITYTDTYKDSTSMLLNLIVKNDATVNGTIDLAGKKGNDGKNGSSSHNDGRPGSTGYKGKFIRLDVENRLEIQGIIDVSGGTGGEGGEGHDDDELFSDPIGDGGRGGNGAAGGNIEIVSTENFIMQEGRLKCAGGTGGQGGNGGDGGTTGKGGKGGDGGTGGNGGIIKITVKHISISSDSMINYKAGDGGTRGRGRDGASNGQNGSGGNLVMGMFYMVTVLIRLHMLPLVHIKEVTRIHLL